MPLAQIEKCLFLWFSCSNFCFLILWQYVESSVPGITFSLMLTGDICVLWRYLCSMGVSVFYGGICVLWTTFSLMLTRNGGICVLWTHSLFIYRTCSYYLQTEGFLKLKKGSAIYLVSDFCNDRGSWLDFMF